MVLDRLRDKGMFVKARKSSFFHNKVEYLGYLIGNGQVKPDPKKIRAITEWPTPLPSITAVRSFLGLAQFYKRFIKDFAWVAAPLTDLTKTTVPFHWNEQAEKAMEDLKKLLSLLPTIHMPNISVPFELQVNTDASGVAVSAVLHQVTNDGREVPVAYASRKLSEVEQRAPVHEQEFFAIHYALVKWRHLLMGREFKVYTDHHALQYFLTQCKLSPKLARMAEFIQQFNMTINYKPGKENIVPDALSRRHDYTNVNTMTSVMVENMDPQLKEAILQYNKDPQSSQIFQKLQGNEPILHNNKLYKLQDDWMVIFVQNKWKIVVPTMARDKVIRVAHGGIGGACGGIEKTMNYIQTHFYWPKMRTAVEKFIVHCPTCMQIKLLPGAQKVLLQPIPLPSHRWSHISVDFITDLPLSPNNKDSIMTVVDYLTKMAHFIPCRKDITAEAMAILFKREIWRLHGLPRVIVSDRDPRFTSGFWTAFTKLLGIKRALSTAFHPETDGQTERCHRTIKQILRYFVCHQQAQLEYYLDQAEFAYNRAKHSSIGCAPFFAMYGYNPQMDFPQLPEEPNDAANFHTNRMRQLEKTLRAAIARMQQQQKKFADKHRRKREFEQGEWVWLNTGHLNFRYLSRKLAPRFIGPFRIIEKLSTVAYRLEIPEHWQIHNVFYIGLLRPHQRTIPRQIRLPVMVANDDEYEVAGILHHRKRADKYSFLVSWKGFPRSEATWQTAEDLINAPNILQEYCRQMDITIS